MTRDPLAALRAANPVPRPVAYADDEVARRIAEIIDHDGQLPALIGDAPPRPRSRGLAAGLVAAAVLVLAVVSAVVFARGNADNDAAGASPVTCAVSTSGGSRAVGVRLKQAEVAIGDRVRQLGGSARSFATDPADGTIGFSPHGVSVAKAARACRAAAFAIRPVVTRPVAVDRRAPRSSHPLSALTFAVPATDAAYARLTPTQRTQLTIAMSHYDCTHPAAAAAALACSTEAGSTQVLLLGAALITGPDVHSAEAIGPSAGRSAEWTVQLSFRASGAARFQAFTGSYHTSSSTVSLSDCGADGPVPCADFLTFTVNGRVETVPVTNAVLDSAVSISGAYDETSAQVLADDCTAASIQLHPR